MPDPQIWSVTSKKGWPKLAVYASQSCHSVVIHPPCGDLGRSSGDAGPRRAGPQHLGRAAVNLRSAYVVIGIGFVMLGAAIASFGLSAPAVVGALFLVAMVVCGVIYFALVARETGRLKATTRAQQRRAPWQD